MNEWMNTVSNVVEEVSFSAFDLSFRILLLPSPIIDLLPSPIIDFQDFFWCCPSLMMLQYLGLGFDINKRRFQVRLPPPNWGALLDILLDFLVWSLVSSCSNWRHVYPFPSLFPLARFPESSSIVGGLHLLPCSLLQSVLTLLFCFVDSRRDALTDGCLKEIGFNAYLIKAFRLMEISSVSVRASIIP